MNAEEILQGIKALLSDRDQQGKSDHQIVETFQDIHGLASDGVIGPITAMAVERPRFCAVEDRMTISGARARWDHTLWTGTGWGKNTPANMRLNYCVASALPGFTMQQTWDAFALALESLSKNCAVEFVLVSDPSNANLLYKVGKIDGPSSTLAWCELPVGKDTPSSQLNSLVDSGEQWVNSSNPSNGKIDIVRVLAHETGHGLGLEHGPEGALLAPYYDKTIREPQAWDIQELQVRYGPHVVKTPDTPPPVPGNGKAVIEIRLPNGTTYHGELEPTT